MLGTERRGLGEAPIQDGDGSLAMQSLRRFVPLAIDHRQLEASITIEGQRMPKLFGMGSSGSWVKGPSPVVPCMAKVENLGLFPRVTEPNPFGRAVVNSGRKRTLVDSEPA